MKGCFITLEGGEGAGKTSAQLYIKEQLMRQGYDIMVTREPGGIRIAEEIRNIILDPNHIEMEGRTEVLLYAAARRQHLVEKILPALETGTIVLCDRFIDSSLAYQGYARHIGVDEVLQINEFATGGYLPDLTLYFDVDPEVGLQRIVSNQREMNRLDYEKLAFHKKVYEGYHLLMKRFPNRIKKIDASQEQGKVFESALQYVREFILTKGSGSK